MTSQFASFLASPPPKKKTSLYLSLCLSLYLSLCLSLFIYLPNSFTHIHFYFFSLYTSFPLSLSFFLSVSLLSLSLSLSPSHHLAVLLQSLYFHTVRQSLALCVCVCVSLSPDPDPVTRFTVARRRGPIVLSLPGVPVPRPGGSAQGHAGL